MNSNPYFVVNDFFMKNIDKIQIYKNQDELFDIINDISIKKEILFFRELNEYLTNNINHLRFLNENWFAFISTSLFISEYETSKYNTIQKVLASNEWLSNYKQCRGLFTFSATYKNDLKRHFNLNTICFIHPLPCSKVKWSFDIYLKASCRRIIQFGQDNRCINAIFMLPRGDFEKILLATCSSEELASLLLSERTNLQSEFRQPMTTTSSLVFDSIDNIENWYNDSIFFLHLYDSSVDWVVLKCISDHVPLLVNRLPSMIEYLGVDYPLFYNNYQEAIEKASNIELVKVTHEYLKERSNESFFSLTFFMNNLYKVLDSQLML
jgi:hypothetical protein